MGGELGYQKSADVDASRLPLTLDVHFTLRWRLARDVIWRRVQVVVEAARHLRDVEGDTVAEGAVFEPRRAHIGRVVALGEGVLVLPAARHLRTFTGGTVADAAIFACCRAYRRTHGECREGLVGSPQ